MAHEMERAFQSVSGRQLRILVEFIAKRDF